MLYPWSHPPQHTISIRVADKDIDALGHVNNCEYLKWMEKAAWGHCDVAGIPFSVWEDIGYAWVARHTEIDYLLPAMPGDELVVGTWIANNDKKLKMTRYYEIFRVKDKARMVTGHTNWVCVKLSNGKPSRMPEIFIEAFQS